VLQAKYRALSDYHLKWPEQLRRASLPIIQTEYIELWYKYIRVLTPRSPRNATVNISCTSGKVENNSVLENTLEVTSKKWRRWRSRNGWELRLPQSQAGRVGHSNSCKGKGDLPSGDTWSMVSDSFNDATKIYQWCPKVMTGWRRPVVVRPAKMKRRKNRESVLKGQYSGWMISFEHGQGLGDTFSTKTAGLDRKGNYVTVRALLHLDGNISTHSWFGFSSLKVLLAWPDLFNVSYVIVYRTQPSWSIRQSWINRSLEKEENRIRRRNTSIRWASVEASNIRTFHNKAYNYMVHGVLSQLHIVFTLIIMTGSHVMLAGTKGILQWTGPTRPKVIVQCLG